MGCPTAVAEVAEYPAFPADRMPSSGEAGAGPSRAICFDGMLKDLLAAVSANPSKSTTGGVFILLSTARRVSGNLWSRATELERLGDLGSVSVTKSAWSRSPLSTAVAEVVGLILAERSLGCFGCSSSLAGFSGCTSESLNGLGSSISGVT